MSHIEKRRNLWYATLKVPEGLRGTLGKTKFLQSLGTPDKRRAESLAVPVIALWKAELRQAEGEPDAVQEELKLWRRTMAEARSAGDQETEAIAHAMLQDRAQELAKAKGTETAEHFGDVALGLRTPSIEHWNGWVASTSHLAQKTQDQAAKDVKALLAKFPAVEDMTATAARKWVDHLAKTGTSPASLKRMVSFWRSYWRYLESVDAVPPNAFPFVYRPPRAARKTVGDSWVPFAPADVPRLWKAAEEGGDAPLADLIRLGAYSGARIEELCSLKMDDIKAKSFTIGDAKTAAGVREVPLHSAVAAMVKARKATSDDGYLFAGLTFNKYGDRSNAIGKRFGRLKTSLGFDAGHVFHSLRKTLVTLLEDAGVSENLAADIVGHEKPRITYGLYSGGASLGTKAAALELVKYPA